MWVLENVKAYRGPRPCSWSSGQDDSRLKAINIHTLEELAESSIDKIRDKLMCTSERAYVLVHKARLLLSGRLYSPRRGYGENNHAESPEE